VPVSLTYFVNLCHSPDLVVPQIFDQYVRYTLSPLSPSLLTPHQSPFEVLEVRTSGGYNVPHADCIHRLYKVVFPGGLDAYGTPSQSATPSRSSTPSIPSNTHSNPLSKPGLLGRFLGSSSSLSVPSRSSSPLPLPDGLPEETVVSGTAFGTLFLHKRGPFELIPSRIRIIQPGVVIITGESKVRPFSSHFPVLFVIRSL
jgi:hypothetical protein